MSADTPEERRAMQSSSPSTSGLSADAQQLLSWFREQYQGGRPPVFSVQEIARGTFGRTAGPSPGSTFDPAAWGRVRMALYELQNRGLIEQGRLPQGDFGYVLRPTAGQNGGQG